MKIFNYQRSKASGLFLTVVATTIFALYIVEFNQLIWQQTKVKNIEKLQLTFNQYEKNVVNQVISILGQYSLISNIPDVAFYTARNGLAKISLVYDNKNLAIPACHAYKMYRIEIINLFDLDKLQTYHSKLHTYAAVCEYGKEKKNEKAVELVSVGTKVFPVSNFED